MDSPGLAYDWIEIGTSDFGTLGLKQFFPERGLLVEPLQQYLDNLPTSANIQKINAAVCAEDGNALVYYIPHETIEKYNLQSWLRGCNRMFVPHPLARPELIKAGLDPGEHIKTVAVETITWLNLVRRARIGSVAYLKIDTEGGETEILKQVMALGQQRPDLYPGRILFETNSNSTFSQIAANIRLLENHGYRTLEISEDDTLMEYCGDRAPSAWVLPKVALFSSAEWALGRISAAVAAYPSNLYDLRVVYWNVYGIDPIEVLNTGGFCLVVAQTLAMAECVEQYIPSYDGRVAAVCHGPIELSPEWTSVRGGAIRAMSRIPVGGVSLELVELISKKWGKGMLTPCGVDIAMFTPRLQQDSDPTLRVLFPRICDPNECHADTKRIVLVGRLMAHFQGHKNIEVTCFEKTLALEKMPGAYRAADVVLILSKSEGNPMAALEGPACGTTLVTTAVGIIPELVTDGLDGFIVKGETEDELFASTVAILERLAGDKELVRSAKNALSKKVRELYSWDRVGAAWEKYICAALKVALDSAPLDSAPPDNTPLNSVALDKL